MFTLYKMTFYLNFLVSRSRSSETKTSLTKENYYKPTDGIKIILEKISEEKIVLEDRYISAE